MNLDADTREELLAEADILSAARAILEARFRPRSHGQTVRAVRMAAAELISRARHPSRNAPGVRNAS